VKCEVVTRSQARTGQANYIPVTGCEANVTGNNVTGKAVTRQVVGTSAPNNGNSTNINQKQSFGGHQFDQLPTRRLNGGRDL